VEFKKETVDLVTEQGYATAEAVGIRSRSGRGSSYGYNKTLFLMNGYILSRVITDPVTMRNGR